MASSVGLDKLSSVPRADLSLVLSLRPWTVAPLGFRSLMLPLWGFILVLSREMDLKSLPLWGSDSVLLESGRLDSQGLGFPPLSCAVAPLGFRSGWTSREATSVGQICRCRRVPLGP